MRVNNLNNSLIILFLYKEPLSLLVPSIVSPLYIKIGLLLMLILITIIINKIKFNRMFLCVYTIMLIAILSNILLVDYREYVIADGLTLLISLFVPLYIFSRKLYDFEIIKKQWYKMVIITTFLLPLYYYYFQEKYISYLDLGIVTHLNSIILIYVLFKSKRSRLKTILLLTINLSVGLIFGARMLIGATLIIILATLFLFTKKSMKNIISLSILTIIGFYLWKKKVEILESIINVLNQNGIHSRNITLLHQQFTELSEENIYLAGRENIYFVVQNYLKTNGFSPSGLSVTRFLTEGNYYHSHNFFLDFFLVFGYIFGVTIIIYLLYKLLLLFLKNNNNFEIILLFLMSFLSRSITGTYFITDSMFIIVISFLMFLSKKKKSEVKEYG